MSRSKKRTKRGLDQYSGTLTAEKVAEGINPLLKTRAGSRLTLGFFSILVVTRARWRWRSCQSKRAAKLNPSGACSHL